jgi:hypothetical protein
MGIKMYGAKLGYDNCKLLTRSVPKIIEII